MPPQAESKQREYNQWYYKKYGGEINRRRKERYQRNKDYREKVKERRRQYYHQNKGPAQPRGRKGESVPRLFSVQGRTLFLYRVSALCRVLGRHHNTVYSWVRQGIIPCFRDDEDGYWFVLEVVRTCGDVVKKHGLCKDKRENTEKLKDCLRAALRDYH